MKRKKIALLAAQADEEYQSEFISGAMKRAFAEGVDLYVFSTYIKSQNTKERETGDTNIFNLIDYSKFDGVILLSDMIQAQGVEPRRDLIRFLVRHVFTPRDRICGQAAG